MVPLLGFILAFCDNSPTLCLIVYVSSAGEVEYENSIENPYRNGGCPVKLNGMRVAEKRLEVNSSRVTLPVIDFHK